MDGWCLGLFSQRGEIQSPQWALQAKEFRGTEASELQEEAAAAKEALPLSFFLGRFYCILSVYSDTHHLDGINFFFFFF